MLRAVAAVVLAMAVVMVVVVEGGTAEDTIPSKSSTKLRFKRDYGLTNDPVMDDPMPADDNGFYYYYYPVDDSNKDKDKDKGYLKYKDEEYYKCSGEKLLAPLIIICIFLGIIAFTDLGLVPSFNLPPIDIPEVEINRGRNLVSAATDLIPWEAFNNVTVAVLAAVEGEECLPWLLCESGRLTQGRSAALSVMELFAPRKYQREMKIFKDSAMLKTSCEKYKCNSFKNPLCALLEAAGGRC